jgi:hypothetical protein
MLKARQSKDERLVDFPEDCPEGMRLLKVRTSEYAFRSCKTHSKK